jgi:hypothetical protein
VTVGTAAATRLQRSPAAPIAVGIGALGVCVYSHATNPAQGGYPPCLFHELTGLWCPGCGGARMLHALTNGHVVTALHDNALTLLALPLLAAVFAIWASHFTDHPVAWPARVPRWSYWALGIAIVAFGVARNLPGAPFHAIAPLG